MVEQSTKLCMELEGVPNAEDAVRHSAPAGWYGVIRDKNHNFVFKFGKHNNLPSFGILVPTKYDSMDTVVP